LQEPELAGPAAARQLPWRMRGLALLVREERDLLEATSRLRHWARNKTEGRERRLKGVQSFHPRDAWGPVLVFHVRAGPPPFSAFPGRPGDAVVALRSRTGDGVVTLCQPGERLFQGAHHR